MDTAIDMASLITRAARVGAAAALAAAAMIATITGTVGDPADACAEPKSPGFDRDGYLSCLEDKMVPPRNPALTADQIIKQCCEQNGGEYFETSGCQRPADNPFDDAAGSPGQLPQLPGPIEATRVPPPPPPGNTAAQLPGLPPIQTR